MTTHEPASEPFERDSHWVPLRAGWLTATSGPSPQRLASWRGRGATDVLTLQRADERPAWLPDTCRLHGLGWIHLPLSGRRLDQSDDRESLARLPALLDLWYEPRRVVIHCAAGLHRTGVITYSLLRLAGLSRDEAVARLRQARARTADELCHTARSGVLIERVETWLRDHL